MQLNGQQSNPDSETLQQLASLSRGEQPDLSPESETQETYAAESQVESQGTQESQIPDDSITIDGQVFKSAKEAYEYSQKKLQEAETERLILQARQEAYEQAIQMGQNRFQAQEAAQAVTPPEDDIDKFYENPQGYLKEMKQKLKAEVQAELSQDDLDRQAWNDFFKKHPDLDGFKQDCELVLNQNLDTIKLLAAKDRGKAMDYLATKTREKFQTYMERMKPQSVLHNTHAGPSVGGNPTPSVTPTTKNETTLDFVSQLRSLNNR